MTLSDEQNLFIEKALEGHNILEGYDPEYEDLICMFWKNITAIDNSVQEFCAEECSRSGEDSKNFVVDLSWVALEDGQIELGYWGRFVNVELRVTLDDQMNITDIFPITMKAVV